MHQVRRAHARTEKHKQRIAQQVKLLFFVSDAGRPLMSKAEVQRETLFIGRSRGGVRDARPPLGVQILSISCSFRENLACSRPPWRVHAPPRENPGSATAVVVGKSNFCVLPEGRESVAGGLSVLAPAACTGLGSDEGPTLVAVSDDCLL